MTSIFTRLRSFFQDADRYSGVNELYRLEGEPVRQIDLIEEAIVSNFSNEIEWKMGYFVERMQEETQLRSIVTYMLVFKDLVSIGPEHAATVFLSYKLRTEHSEVLRFFNSYITKVAFNRELYSDCLQAYNNLHPQISCIRAYKALNLLEEVFHMVGLVRTLQHRQLYHRLSISLVSDAVLYFIYVKQAILRSTGENSSALDNQHLPEGKEDPNQLLNIVEEFMRVGVEFRRVLFDFKIQNSYYRQEEQKAVSFLRRSLHTRVAMEIKGPLTERNTNAAVNPQTIQFSFGASKTERPTTE